jgi:phosphoglycerate kinase
MAQLNQLPLQNARVLVRLDLNVPLDDQGRVADNSRIAASLPTIRYLLSQNCKVILMSHLGRPKGADPVCSLKPVAAELSKLLGLHVKMAPDCIGESTSAMVHSLRPGEILLLENLRFHAAEEKPESDPSFARKLASFGDFYVDDAFGCAHRAHASIVGVPKLLPHKTAAGFLLEKEMAFLGKALKQPERPYMALIGGAKISTKIGILKSLSQSVDILAIGGAMAFTFLKALGKNIGESLVEDEFLQEAKLIMQLCDRKKVELLLPTDFVVAKKADDLAEAMIVAAAQGIPPGYAGYDIGPATVQLFTNRMKQARTILWNGPMGVFEKKPFAEGTWGIGKAFVENKAITIAGGGETIAAIQSIPGKENITHLSTGGGAMLEYIELGTLPGIEVLDEKKPMGSKINLH